MDTHSHTRPTCTVINSVHCWQLLSWLPPTHWLADQRHWLPASSEDAQSRQRCAAVVVVAVAASVGQMLRSVHTPSARKHNPNARLPSFPLRFPFFIRPGARNLSFDKRKMSSAGLESVTQRILSRFRTPDLRGRYLTAMDLRT